MCIAEAITETSRQEDENLVSGEPETGGMQTDSTLCSLPILNHSLPNCGWVQHVPTEDVWEHITVATDLRARP